MSPQLKTHRLYFALWPDESCRAALARAVHKAVRGSGFRPVPVDNWHVTLVFLGSVAGSLMSSVTGAAARVPFIPFRLTFDRIEHWTKPAVLCLTASKPPRQALELAQELHRALVSHGFNPDPKPWRAHLTVARKVAKPHVFGPIDPIGWEVQDFALIESETLPEGPRYTVLDRWDR